MVSPLRLSGLQPINVLLNAERSSAELIRPPVGVDLDGEPLLYFSYIDSLRIKVAIRSLPEVFLPEGFEDLTELDQRAVLRDRMYGTSHVGMQISLHTPDGNGGEMVTHPVDLGLVNRPPFYSFSALNYYTDAAVFGIAPDSRLTVSLVDTGSGLLVDGDAVEVWGFARYEAPELWLPPTVVTAAAAPTTESIPDNAITHNGQVVVHNGQVVVQG